jgi:hypothetical protein
MSRTSVALAIATLSVAALCAACAGTPVRVGDTVPPDVDRSHGRAVFGVATGYQILAIFPYDNNDRHARAYQQLKQMAGDAYVTDVAVKESWTYLGLGTAYTTTFRAKAYPKSPAPAPADAAR